mmetsp:Transcript_484/g.908  ORF Transcript_484/g.908 Transcript_484/m.908 type:complete len:542 (+) Transcript_484:155-1780(+)|eukprot:CAMPEP_0178859736 /NCGR_PEP_ID=MMETSP0747-20121128/1365_1 /TAXON_ID=913974 /ORGANISM="Nitzschia punctata, Strain CCMP561" /LENGTH=541 /DNA_ID=CAMNT_0020526135 /DNA_START=77 /DNA_END=1705 /DNA_ORIENTATION=-
MSEEAAAAPSAAIDDENRTTTTKLPEQQQDGQEQKTDNPAAVDVPDHSVTATVGAASFDAEAAANHQEESKGQEEQQVPAPAVKPTDGTGQDVGTVPETKPVAGQEEEGSKQEQAKDDAQVLAEAAAAATPVPEEELGDPILEPADMDVLSGRGASVNGHPGNKKFRALCFVRKPLFDAGNHAAKRRIATEIVHLMMKPADSSVTPSRFLKKRPDKGAYFVMTEEQAIIKAQQVMRDYKRPDRVAMREQLEKDSKFRKRNRTVVSTPLDEPIPEMPKEPIIENPFGVHSHDVLCGRGAFVNGHIGNERLRKLAHERKKDFDSGNYTDKRKLATEIVHIIQNLSPPGRFLKRAADASKSGGAARKNGSEEKPGDGAKSEDGTQSELIDGVWEKLNEEKAIHKACQVMRDIDRQDRKYREERKLERKRRKLAKANGLPLEDPGTSAPKDTVMADGAKDSAAVKDEKDQANGVCTAEAPKDGDAKTPVKETGSLKDGQGGAAEPKDVDMADAAEKAAVQVVDNALDGTSPQPPPVEPDTEVLEV